MKERNRTDRKGEVAGDTEGEIEMDRVEGIEGDKKRNGGRKSRK